MGKHKQPAKGTALIRNKLKADIKSLQYWADESNKKLEEAINLLDTFDTLMSK